MIIILFYTKERYNNDYFLLYSKFININNMTTVITFLDNYAEINPYISKSIYDIYLIIVAQFFKFYFIIIITVLTNFNSTITFYLIIIMIICGIMNRIFGIIKNIDFIMNHYLYSSED